MKRIYTQSDLKEAIIELEIQQFQEGRVLKAEFHKAYESVKPINLIKSTLKEVSASDEIKKSLINKALSLGLGYAAKLLFESTINIPYKKTIGSAIMYSLQALVEKNSDSFNFIGRGIASLAKRRFTTRKQLLISSKNNNTKLD